MNQTDELLARFLAAIEADEQVALVTVIEATGEYRTALGQRALVWADKTYGRLQLGSLEAEALQNVQQNLEIPKPKPLRYQRPHGQVTLFVDLHRRAPTLLIIGAGHVALPLAELGKLIEFKVVVVDDRPKYANPRRFPKADQVLAQPFTEMLRDWPINRDTYIILVTRGHSHDVEAL